MVAICIVGRAFVFKITATNVTPTCHHFVGGREGKQDALSNAMHTIFTPMCYVNQQSSYLFSCIVYDYRIFHLSRHNRAL